MMPHSQGGKLRYSHHFFADKDENFVLRRHAPHKVQQIILFLLFVDNQHRLLHRVHSLQHQRGDEGKGYLHIISIFGMFFSRLKGFFFYSL